ncbi:MAG TPA: HD family hydrolase [Pyrinomonadaceae bacterium]|nr:HD family hydrolase [Pyrinomonadaceae bacterium]
MLETLIELQRLKRLDRTGWILRGLPNGTESVASHSFGVAVTAMFIADRVNHSGVQVDLERVMRLALLHDWPEVLVGDMPRTATMFFGSDVRKNAEGKAFAEIVAPMNDLGIKYRELHAEYEERNSLEAKIVKVADIIDLLVQALALERAGAKGLDEFWVVAEKREFLFEGAAETVVDELFESLLQERQSLLEHPA